jgi:hypothetical protein
MLPGFGPGQGIISGQAVRFPLLVRIKMDEELVYTDLGDENFLEQAENWKPDKYAPVRARVAATVQKLSKLPDRRPKVKKGGAANTPASPTAGRTAPLTEVERWDKVRKAFAKDARAMGDLEAATGKDWDRSRRGQKVAAYANLTWDKLKQKGLSNAKRKGLLHLLEAAAEYGPKNR